MKPSKQDKSSIISGVVILMLAAVFTISLLIQAFDFGTYGADNTNLLYILGKMLFSVYGFSSLLIPTFFLIAGLSCFASNWTARKAFRLLTAIVPFFTCVICENLCRSVLIDSYSKFPAVKIVVVLITGLMLVIIELVGAGIIADKITGKSPAKVKKPKPVKEPKQKQIKKIEEEEEIDDEEIDVEEFPEPESKITEEPETELDDEIDEEPDEEKEEAQKPKQKKFANIFKKLKKDKPSKKDKIDDIDDIDSFEEEDTINDSDNPNPEDKNSAAGETEQSDKPTEEKQEVKIHPAFEKAFDAYELPQFVKDKKAAESKKNEEVAEKKNENVSPNNKLGNLSRRINLEPEPEVIEEKNDDDDLPMQPLLSKEEYDALMADGLEWNNLPPEQEELPPDYSPDYFDDQPVNTADVTEVADEEVEEIDESNVQPIEYDEPTPEVDDFGMPTSELDDTPTEWQDDEVDESVDALDDSLFNIEFDDSTGDAINDTEPDEDFFGEEVLDEDFPSEEILGEESDSDSGEADSEEAKKKTYKQFLIESVRSASNDTGMTTDVTPNEDLTVTDTTKETESIEDPENTNTSPDGMFSIATDIFDDMEDDIRKENGLPNEPANYVMYEGQKIPVQPESSDPHLNSATNLTPDGMENFFNAQNKANAPVTEEIQGNLPSKKSHRAAKKGPYIIPSDLLTEYDADQYWIIDDATKDASIDLKNTLAEFKIEAEIIGIKKGPVVTMFELLPAPGVRLSKIVGLQDNIALRLAASSIRIVAPIPGKRAVGIEVPNKHRSIVSFRELIEQKLDEFKKMAIPVVLGKDILGKAQLLDLVKTPHLLIAGATGAGKSVCVNSIILSILYKRAPDKVKLILVDPKVVELKLYNDIPHLLTPVITEPKKAFQALQYCLCEMERRYSMLDNMGVRDISSYNARIKERHLAQETLPYIVVIIDEFADLMATTGKELEQTVSRLTAMSRAVGIHLVLATQRPSVNVITGLIKANIPSRIAFMVASRMDSSIIIDSVGAEKLLGRGDMLYASAVDPNPVRIQGTFVSDEEVEAVVDYVKQYGEPEYIDEEIFVEDEDEQGELFGSDEDFGDDPLYDQALEIVVREGKASASFIQRKLKIGYNRAARLVEEMEERGIVGPANGSKPREVIHVP